MTPERADGPDGQTDIDRQFAEIIAHFDPPQYPWEDAPAAGEQQSAERDGTPTAEDRPTSSTDDSTEQSPPAALPSQWRIPSEAESMSFLEDDGDFEAPPLRPLPDADDLGFWSILGCLVAGPLWLLYLFLFDQYAAALWWVLACALIVAGVVQLIMRQPRHRPDDGDDGARL